MQNTSSHCSTLLQGQKIYTLLFPIDPCIKLWGHDVIMIDSTLGEEYLYSNCFVKFGQKFKLSYLCHFWSDYLSQCTYWISNTNFSGSDQFTSAEQLSVTNMVPLPFPLFLPLSIHIYSWNHAMLAICHSLPLSLQQTRPVQREGEREGGGWGVGREVTPGREMEGSGEQVRLSTNKAACRWRPSL